MRDNRRQRVRRVWSDAEYRCAYAGTENTPPQSPPAYVALLMIGGLALGLSCFGTALSDAVRAVLFPLGVVCLALLPVILRFARIPKELVQDGRCAACLYDLSAAPTEDDGCTVCPECGAAWRITPSDDQP